MALAGIEHRQSHALATGVSVGVHALFFALLLFAAVRSPREVDTPNVAVALLAPNLARPGLPGRIGGSGMPSVADPAPRPETRAERNLTRVANSLDVKHVQPIVPAR